MSLERTCYFCGEPVSIRRRMAVFCSDRCEQRYQYVRRAPPRAPDAPPVPHPGPPHLPPPAFARESPPRSE